MRQADMVDKMQQAEHLGCEFLTWLYWSVARRACHGVTAVVDVAFSEDGRRFAPNGCGRVSVSFERAVTLEDAERKERVTVQERDPAQSSEVRHALRQGKIVTQARLALSWLPAGQDQQIREFGATVKGRTLALSGVDLPSVMDVGPKAERDEDATLLEKMYLMGELDALVLALYRTFVETRQGEEWDTVRDEISAWIQGSEAAEEFREKMADMVGPSGSMTIEAGGRTVTIKGR